MSPVEGVSAGGGADARMLSSRTARLEAQKSWKSSLFWAHVSEDWQSDGRVQVRGLEGRQKQVAPAEGQGKSKMVLQVRPGRQVVASKVQPSYVKPVRMEWGRSKVGMAVEEVEEGRRSRRKGTKNWN